MQLPFGGRSVAVRVPYASSPKQRIAGGCTYLLVVNVRVQTDALPPGIRSVRDLLLQNANSLWSLELVSGFDFPLDSDWFCSSILENAKHLKHFMVADASFMLSALALSYGPSSLRSAGLCYFDNINQLDPLIKAQCSTLEALALENSNTLCSLDFLEAAVPLSARATASSSSSPRVPRQLSVARRVSFSEGAPIEGPLSPSPRNTNAASAVAQEFCVILL